MARRWSAAAVLAALAATTEAQAKEGPSTFRWKAPGAVRAVRAIDLDRDGRKDLVLLVETSSAHEVVVLRTPPVPHPDTYFPDDAVRRWPLDGDDAGTLASAAALAVGRFGPQGAPRLRFLGPDGVFDVDPVAKGATPSKVAGPTLLARLPHAPLVFLDAVADLDGDGRDEAWWPDAEGRTVVGAVAVPVVDRAHSAGGDLFGRTSRAPALTPADVDGDGRLELVRLEGTTLVVEYPFAGGPGQAAGPLRVDLPFLAADPKRPPEEIRTPRLTLADVDGDRRADLLVTMVSGRADRVGGLRTSLYHVAGPFVDPTTGRVAPIKSRVDTESVALHPHFVDVDGDGRLDYVADSIRGNTLDLIKRVMGAEPEITFTVVRFDPATGTFERTPFVTFARPYSAAQARSNTFGRSAFFQGDFDGDGVRDLLDLGNLRSFGVWRGRRDGDAFKPVWLARVSLEGAALAPDAVVADLDGDGRADAVLWADDTVHVVSSVAAGAPR